MAKVITFLFEEGGDNFKDNPPTPSMVQALEAHYFCIGHQEESWDKIDLKFKTCGEIAKQIVMKDRIDAEKEAAIELMKSMEIK